MTVTMKRAALLACLIAFAPAIAAADITEVTAARDGDTARVLISFDGQPTLATASRAGGAVRLTTRGASAAPGEIAPPAGSPVTGITISPGPDFEIRFDGAAGDANAQLYENAVLLTVTLSGGEAVAEAAGTADSGTPDGEEAERSGPVRLTMDPIPNPEDRNAAMAAREAGEAGEDAAAEAETDEAPAEGETQTAAAEAAPQAPEQAGSRGGDTPSGEAISFFAARLDPAACQRAEQESAADSWNMQAVMRLAACRARAGETAEARELYNRILTFDPYSAEAVAGLGAIAQDAGNAGEARQRYEQALGMSPGDGLAALIRQMMARL